LFLFNTKGFPYWYNIQIAVHTYTLNIFVVSIINLHMAFSFILIATTLSEADYYISSAKPY